MAKAAAKRQEGDDDQVDTTDEEVTTENLSRAFGVDVRTIQRLAAEGMPRRARGKFPRNAAFQWYLQREREAARGSKGLNDLDLARQRKTVAEARKAELELATIEGQVITMDLHQKRLRERLETVAGAIKANGRYHADVKAAITDEAADRLLQRMGDEQLAELFDLKDEIE